MRISDWSSDVCSSDLLAVCALLARIGTSDAVEPVADMAPLIEQFDFAHFGRATARFDEAELAQLNAKIVHHLPFEAVADRLPPGMDARAWEVIRPNLHTVMEAHDLWQMVEGPDRKSTRLNFSH